MAAIAASRPIRFAAASAVFVVVLGAAVLVGWFTHTPRLIQLLPQLAPVRRNAAACLVLCGVALLALSRGRNHKLILTCAGIVGLVSVLTLIEIVFGVNLGIDELLGPAYIPVALANPGRLPAVSAICFGLITVGLMLTVQAQSKRVAYVVVLDASIVAAVGVATIMANALGFSVAYGWDHVTRTPVLTSLGFFVLGLGMLALLWHRDPDQATIPDWLPVSVAIGVVTSTLGLWQALIAVGHAPFALLPAVVLMGGCLIALLFGLTIYLSQRAHIQAAALRRSEASLAEGQRLSMTGSFVWRLETDEITFSAELRRIFALEDVPLTLQRILARVHPDDLPLVAEKLVLARAGVVDHDYEVRLKMPDESVKYLRTYAHATRDPDGRLEFAGAMQDITQRRRSEEDLSAVRSDLARVSRITSLGALTAAIAHELNQPLSGIITNASTCLRMLAADAPNIEGARETARRTIRDGNRAAEVIRKLRAIYSGKDLSPEVVDLNETARDVIALSLSELRRNRVVLRTEFAADLPVIMGDRLQLQQVMLNLLRNASDAMSGIDNRSRELVVRTERDGEDRVRLSVRDVGVGLAPEAAERLFDAFHTTKPDGLGMGLSVSRSIIETHRGKLWATVNAGPGMTFTFSIPRDLHAPAGVRAPRIPPMPPRLARGERPVTRQP